MPTFHSRGNQRLDSMTQPKNKCLMRNKEQLSTPQSNYQRVNERGMEMTMVACDGIRPRVAVRHDTDLWTARALAGRLRTRRHKTTRGSQA